MNARGYRGRSPGLWQQWRTIWRHKYYENGNLTDSARQIGAGENEVTRAALYLELLSVAPYANGGTKRKWRKALALP